LPCGRGRRPLRGPPRLIIEINLKNTRLFGFNTKIVKKIDKIFQPLKLNPDDSKVIFHPVDYIVFNGMKAGQMKNLILLDKAKGNKGKRLQESIQKVVEKRNYEWITLRVEDNGNIKQE
jgi:predicted Holliday junction resolvase-like endonuclease